MIHFLGSSANVANLIIRHNIIAQSMVKSELINQPTSNNFIF